VELYVPLEGGHVPARAEQEQVADPAEVDLVSGAGAEGGERLKAAGAELDVGGVGELRPPPASGLAGRAGGQLVALHQDHLGDTGLGQVEGDAGAHHAPADHDHAGPPGEAAPWAAHSGTRVPTPCLPARSRIAQAAAASCTPRPRLLKKTRSSGPCRPG